VHSQHAKTARLLFCQKLKKEGRLAVIPASEFTRAVNGIQMGRRKIACFILMEKFLKNNLHDRNVHGDN
jgi:hypothetical protein